MRGRRRVARMRRVLLRMGQRGRWGSVAREGTEADGGWGNAAVGEGGREQGDTAAQHNKHKISKVLPHRLCPPLSNALSLSPSLSRFGGHPPLRSWQTGAGEEDKIRVGPEGGRVAWEREKGGVEGSRVHWTTEGERERKQSDGRWVMGEAARALCPLPLRRSHVREARGERGGRMGAEWGEEGREREAEEERKKWWEEQAKGRSTTLVLHTRIALSARRCRHTHTHTRTHAHAHTHSRLWCALAQRRESAVGERTKGKNNERRRGARQRPVGDADATAQKEAKESAPVGDKRRRKREREEREERKREAQRRKRVFFFTERETH